MMEIRNRRDGRVEFRVQVRPSARKNELLGWNAAGELRVKIAAPPRGGEANKELISFLAKYFSLHKREIIIESGKKSHVKVISAPASIRGTLVSLPLL
jgi:uncharacterized protein (TIGR00251 family)